MKSFEWLSISSIDDIDSDEKFKEIKEQLIKDTDLQSVLAISDKNDLWKVITAFRKSRSSQFGKDDYFISEKHQLAFCILKHEGNIFDEELGISKIHYLNKERAKEWKSRLLKQFHPDQDTKEIFKNNKEVSQKINKIYRRMVGEA